MQLSLLGTIWTLLSDNLLTPQPTVNVPGVGKIAGTRLTSTFRKRDINGFWGIPYALPPTGRRRFASPQPPKRLNNGHSEFNANQLKFLLSPSTCPQPGTPSKSFLDHVLGRDPSPTTSGKEDCLNLAVFTPTDLTQPIKKSKLLPVIVFIHGGGFSRGSYSALGPQHLLDQDVVLVNVHYRFSTLGFLCLDIPSAPGNMGLLDQIMALKWVKKHIKHFGGDPTHVTLMGESAGSASVSYLMNSPLAIGLFSKAVLLSGTFFAQWSLNTDPVKNARGIGRILGCPTQDLEKMVKCMKYRKSVSDIVQASEKFRKKEQLEGGLGPEVTAPCLTNRTYPQVFSQGFLDKNKKILVNPVPALVGSVQNEGTLFAALTVIGFFSKNKNTLNPYYYQNQFILDMLEALYVDTSDPDIVMKTKKAYFKEHELGTLKGVLPGLSSLMGRYIIKEPAHDFAQLNSLSAPTYLSSFDYKGKNTLFDYLIPSGVDRPPVEPGVAHSDDLLYFFFLGVVELEGYDLEVVKHFIKIITDFVFTDVPYYGLDPISPYGEKEEFLQISRHNYIDTNYTKNFYRKYN